mmetsp:Transcript_9230/g.17548  ORF Transcript_9230/g.17548 Transcript_9230/m.17548 type:complete len:888 (+) Transcript_9230:49-2712(+)
MGCCSSKTRSRYKSTVTHPHSEENLISTADLTGGGGSPNIRKRIRHTQSAILHSLPEENEEAHNARITKPDKTEASKRLIHEALKKHMIFNSLTEDNSQVMIAAMKLYRLNAGDVIFEQGMPGSNFYIIAAGRVEILVNRRKVNTLRAGDSFGELALLQNLPRSATARTLESSQLWVIDRLAFNEALKIANSAAYSENKLFIEGVSMLQVLTPTQRDALISSLNTQKYGNGDVIIKEGDIGELFYIIKEGIVVCSHGGEEIRKLFKGDFFGEQALLYSCTRTATCTAVGTVKCLSITRAKLNKALGSSLQKIIYKNTMRIAFSKSQTLNKLTSEQKEKIIERMDVKSYKKNAIVIESGTKMGRKLWIVVKGALSNEGSHSAFAGLYMSIGDHEILANEKGHFLVNIIAKDECDIAEIGRAEIERILGSDMQTATLSNSMVDILKKAEIFHGLSPDNLQRLSTHMTLHSFRDGQVIFEQGSKDTNFYVIKEGTVDIIKDGAKVRSITILDYFGERSILSNEPRSATVVCRGDVVCWLLSRDSFHSVISQKVIEYLRSRIVLQDESVTLEQLAPVQVVGRGNFGTVCLVAHKQNGSMYALKSIPRVKIVKFDIMGSVQEEKNVLALLNHMFILRSIKPFEDQHRVYFLTEFVRGLDLFDALRRIGLVSDEDAKFYTASILLILEHLHERSIVYRDLKPENILVDHTGYLKLVDFGTAKIISDRTYTILGTPHYMAPEVILGKGYNCLADFWTLGIILYEFICGMLPFGDDLRNPYDIYEAVLSNQITYPRYVHRPFPSQPFIEQLLSKNPASRLGGNIENLKNHKWFKGYDWDRLTSKEYPPPFVPEVPDYSEKVKRAMKTQLSIHEFLLAEENKGEKSPPRHMKKTTQ